MGDAESASIFELLDNLPNQASDGKKIDWTDDAPVETAEKVSQEVVDVASPKELESAVTKVKSSLNSKGELAVDQPNELLNKTDRSGKLPSMISNSNKKSTYDDFIPKNYMQKTTVERRSPQSYRKRFTERVNKTSKKFEKSRNSMSPSGHKTTDQTTYEYLPAKDPGAGKTSMTHAEFLRMTNLHSRKAEVLRIATENYRMAQRLAGVRSSIGRE